jgi:hypothetical protein
MQRLARSCLVIPDVHQDLAWVERIFACERIDAPDCPHEEIVFLGDYFDSRRPPRTRAGVAATCVWLNEKHRTLGPRAVFLLGNHDVQYLEARSACLQHRTPRHLRYKCGAAFSHSAAKQIAKTLSAGFWRDARLFVQVNGWLLSHAGLTSVPWSAGATWDESRAVLEASCVKALRTTSGPDVPHPLLQAGRARGGDAPVGGITWLDWDDEFEDTFPLPQIVGHTVSETGARRRGRSWCLDGGQTCYGILTPDDFSVRSV